MVQSVGIEVSGSNPANRTITIAFDSNNKVVVDLAANILPILSAGQRNNPTVIAQRASDFIQMLVDAGPPNLPIPSRSLITVYDPEDPARLADPAQPDFFWARVVAADQLGNGANRVDVYRPTALVGGTATHIIARVCLVTVTYDGTNYNINTESPPTRLR